MSTIEKKSSRRHVRRPGGFTLMELLLVVVLLGVLAGVVFPRLKGTVRAAGLDEAGERLADVVRFMRAESVRRGLTVRLTLDLGRGCWSAALQNGESGHAEDFVSFEDDLLDGEQCVPDGVKIVGMREEPAGRGAVRGAVLDFTPDGVSEPFAIELEDGEGRRVAVEIGAWMDEVKAMKVMNDE